MWIFIKLTKPVIFYFSQVNNLSRAVKDLTRAIHIKPDAYDLHVMR